MSDLALQLIAENRKTRETFLDLGNCGLTEIPREIKELAWLKSLSLSSEWSEWDGKNWNKQKSQNSGDKNDGLIDLAALASLTALQTLYVSGTQVADLAPLASLTALQTLNVTDTHVANLAPLASLTALQTLDVSRTEVADLSPLASLTALQTLYVSGTQVANLPPLASLTALQTLDVSRTEVADLSPLASLTALRTINVSGTPVADLSPLASLTALQTLDVSRTQVANLAPLASLTALRTLNVSGTPVADFAPLASLTALQTIDVSGTPVADFAPLASLTALRTINVSGTPVADLSPLASLTALQTLDVSRTPVADLSPLASLTALRTINVSGTPVADLSPLASLTALQTLDVSRTQVANLSPLASLRALRTLNVSGTPVANLSPLASLRALRTLNVSGTPVADLSPLASLSRLQTLYVSGPQVTDLSPLASLSRLQTLNVWNTRVANLGPIASLTGLQTISVSGTQVTDLARLASLTGLRTIDVARTQVRDLSPLASLTALQLLNVSNTQVDDLSPLRSLISRGCPAIWSSSWSHGSGSGIYVEGCPLINPPAEIVNQGNDAILNYFRERELGDVDHLYEAKVLILGEGGAGKTSLLRRLYQPDQPLPTEQESTKGISIYRHQFLLRDGQNFHLNVWDFGGQQIYHETHQFFLTRRSLYLLVDDTRKDHKSVSDEGFKYWLELIDLFGGHSPVLIFQNEKGGRSKAIDMAGIKGRYDNVIERYAGNLEYRTAVDKLREGIEFYASNLVHIGEELPDRWIKVRTDIEKRAAEVPHITQQEYFAIYGRHMEFDRTKALLVSRYLHDLGVFLHFQDDWLLKRTVILQNAWATDAVFRILDDETVKAQFGRFNSADCERIWRDSVYADMHPELLALMQRFELCYLLADSKPQTWLAPQLLPPAKPIKLADSGTSEDLILRYRYDFMPKGVISRLTVRLHRFVRDPEMAWITGVLFERDTTTVLVKVLPSGRDIELRGRGPERKALLSVVSADLDALNESFQGLRDKIDKCIPCNCKPCREVAVPEFFAQKNLLKRVEHNRLKVGCPSSFEDVDVIELLDGIRVDKLPGWAKAEKPAMGHRRIRIFLASSAELRDDRDAFDLYVRQQNDEYSKEGIHIEIIRWENFLDAMSETRLQDEYNKQVRACDIFVSLFFTKTGKFTEEEFDTAYRQFKETGLPRIYTFFKNAPVPIHNITDEINSLLKFKKKLGELGHFHTNYNNIEDLKLRFRGQLDKLIAGDH